jgi:NADH dehydrogenase FAD-containing subunit
MAASNMRVIQATAIRLDVQAHELELSTGEVLRYNKLCIATGAVPKVQPMSGASRCFG